MIAPGLPRIHRVRSSMHCVRICVSCRRARFFFAGRRLPDARSQFGKSGWMFSFLEHPSLLKFLPLAQTYCKTRGRHQNTVNVHFFLLRAFFPKLGWSVLQDDRSLNFRKERAEFEVQNKRKYPQKTSAHIRKRVQIQKA